MLSPREGAPDAQIAGMLAEGRTCTPPTSILVINELRVHTEPDLNWFEVFNPGPDPVDLEGWQVADSRTQHWPIQDSIPIPPGGFAVICRSDDPDRNGGVACNLAMDLDLKRTQPLNRLALIHGIEIVDEVAYGTRWPLDRSMQLRHPYLENDFVEVPDDPSDPAAWNGLAWGVQAVPGATPGAPNDEVWSEQDAPECDDGDPCTWDLCIAGICDSTRPRPDCCRADQECPGPLEPCAAALCQDNRCVIQAIPGCCVENTDCVDQNPCTFDYCYMGRCRHSPGDRSCCWVSPIDPATGLVMDAAERQALADAMCDDANPCTTDRCDLDAALCTAGPARDGCCRVPSECDDADPCTWDLCVGTVCIHNQKAGRCCVENGGCDDGDPCTQDVCFFGQCRNFFDADDCCKTDLDCRWRDDGDPCTQTLCRLEPTAGRRVCVHVPLARCTRTLPWFEGFERDVPLSALGWRVESSEESGDSSWLATAHQMAGPGRALVLNPGGPDRTGWTAAISPRLDVRAALPDPSTPEPPVTIQWRMSWLHARDDRAVTLSVLPIAGSSFDVPALARFVTTGDLPESLWTATLPGYLRGTSLLELAFRADGTPGATLGTWVIDNVRAATGYPNRLERVRVVRCRPGTKGCGPSEGDVLADVRLPDALPPIHAAPCERVQAHLCFRDPDGGWTRWSVNGFPGAALEPATTEPPDFVRLVDGPLNHHGCASLPMAVRGMCGEGDPGKAGERFYCTIQIEPPCDTEVPLHARIALTARDEWGPFVPGRSLFESRTELDLIVEVDGLPGR